MIATGAAVTARGDAAARGALPKPQRVALEDYVRGQMQAQGIPGIAVAVIRQGQPILARGFGTANLEHAVPVRADTRFQIGSIGKQFTAVLIEQLAREGRLGLEAPLSRYIPEVPAGWAAVTLGLMLKHQSGIPQLTSAPHALLDLHHDYTEDEYIRLATSLPLDFAPGTDAAYSDTAYVLLGFVIGRVTGRFYGELLQERIFAPLGMRRTRVLSDADIIVGRAAGYEVGPDGALRNQDYVSPFLNRTADGSLYSTVLDLAQWDAALEGDRILPQALLRRMWRVDPLADGRAPLLHYGYGWEINSIRGHPVIEYDGNWQGFQAALARYPETGLTVIVLTNRALCRAQRIAHAIAGLIEPTLAPYPPHIADRRPADTAAVQQLLQAARAGAALSGYFEASAWARYGSGWAHSLQRDLEEVGALREFALVGAKGAQERIYRAEFQNMTEYLRVRQSAGAAIEEVDVVHEY